MILFLIALFTDRYINQYGCDMYGYKDNGMTLECTTPYAFGFVSVVFFVIFTVFGSLIMLNLFIGVIVTSMEEALVEEDERQDNLEEIRKIVDENKLPPEIVALMLEAFSLLDIDGGFVFSDQFPG